MVRYPGVASYRLVLKAVGVIAVIDGAGGRTLATADWSKEPFRFEGEDVETAQRVVNDWAAWCREAGLDLWPR